MRIIASALLISFGALASVAQAQELTIEGGVGASGERIITRPVFDSRQSARPEYPQASSRAYEQGEVVLQLCVSDEGKVTSSAIARSSSFERLDQASLEWINRATFKPASTEDGPVAVCGYRLTYVWDLQGDTFAPFHPLSNAFALGLATSAMGSEEPLYPMLDGLEAVTAPKFLSAPPPPIYPAQLPQVGKFVPVFVEVCVAPQGRAVAVSRLGEIHPFAGVYVLTWLISLRYEPAMQDGAPIGVCGVEVRMTWRGGDARRIVTCHRLPVSFRS